jgi:predicted PurR-regulated permease PerM
MNTTSPKLEQNLARGILVLLFLGCLVVLWPFFTALLWAAVLSFTIWPLFQRLLKTMGGRRSLAALTLCLAMVLAILVPIGVVGLNLGDNIDELKTASQRLLDNGLPSAPAWVAKVPLVGKTATENWNSVAGDTAKLAEKAKELLEPVSAWLLRAGLNLGVGLIQIALSILLTFFFLLNGDAMGITLSDGIRRIGGPRAAELLHDAGKTVRGVVYGNFGHRHGAGPPGRFWTSYRRRPRGWITRAVGFLFIGRARWAAPCSGPRCLMAVPPGCERLGLVHAGLGHLREHH